MIRNTVIFFVSAMPPPPAIYLLSCLVPSDDRKQGGQDGPGATKEAAPVILMVSGARLLITLEPNPGGVKT